MKRSLLALACCASLLATTTLPATAHPLPPPPLVPAPHAGGAPIGLFVCPGLLVFSAFVVGFRDNRELTQGEAFTCGVLGLFQSAPPAPPPQRIVHHVSQKKHWVCRKGQKGCDYHR